jgi:hypothetical protein
MSTTTDQQHLGNLYLQCLPALAVTQRWRRDVDQDFQ